MAIVDPNNEETLAYIKKIQEENGWEITLYVISYSSMERVWNKYKEVPFIESLDTIHVAFGKRP